MGAGGGAAAMRGPAGASLCALAVGAAPTRGPGSDAALGGVGAAEVWAVAGDDTDAAAALGVEAAAALAGGGVRVGGALVGGAAAIVVADAASLRLAAAVPGSVGRRSVTRVGSRLV